jgi:predicted nucleotidyltransferase
MHGEEAQTICSPLDLPQGLGWGCFFRRRLMRGTGYNIRTRKGRVKRRVLADVVRRVVEAARPDKIILFGSAARGQMGPHSDLDLLVVKAGEFDRARLITAIYRQLAGVDAAVDVVVATPEEVQRYRNAYCLVICPALKEGKVVYDAETLPTR